jgi:hypothetical protein
MSELVKEKFKQELITDDKVVAKFKDVSIDRENQDETLDLENSKFSN